MRRAAPWAGYAALLAVIAALGVGLRAEAPLSSPMPSIENPSAAGLKALFVYLKEGGRDVRAWTGPLTGLPPDLRTLVIAAPTERPVTSEEIEGLERFVRAGGALVYLAPRTLAAQARLHRWLGLREGPFPEASGEGAGLSGDPLGRTAQVWRPVGAMAGASLLRVGRERGVELHSDDALPIAGSGGSVALWRRSLGAGEIWVWAGPDAAENRRIELADNLIFWVHLGERGAVAFDEGHFAAEPLPAVSHGLWALGVQLLACAALFAWARGSRLGPPRVEPVERHRPAIEYLESLAWLTRRARVERELVAELRGAFRAALHERTAIPVTLPDDDVARELEEHWGIPAEHYLRFAEDLASTQAQAEVSSRDYARLSRTCASLELRLGALRS